jgi:hypothetical protein
MDPRIQTRRDAAAVARIARSLTVHDPVYNLREVAKQLCLLEEHLAIPHKVCPDCIRKHLLTIEALAEEAACLNTDGQIDPPETCHNLADVARLWMKNFTDGRPLPELAADVRTLRKQMVQDVYDPRAEESVQRLARRWVAAKARQG